MKRWLSFVVCVDAGSVVARCLDVEITGKGATELAAVAQLHEALTLYFAGNHHALAALPSREYRLGDVVVRTRT